MQKLKNTGGPAAPKVDDRETDTTGLKAAADRAKELLKKAENERRESERQAARERERVMSRRSCCGCCY